jgi:HAD superfamily hydrolase (TIGR01450 family)
MAGIPKITSELLVEQYDVLLFDAYGVLVDSSGALPGAKELIRHLNNPGKPYYILTNDASRLPETASTRYRKSGIEIPPGQIITSGSLLTGYFKQYHLSGKRCIVLGTDDSRLYVDQAGGRIVSPEEDMDILVVADERGYPFLETIEAAFSSLCRAMDDERSVHLILPNPDLLFPKGGQAFGFGAGSIASMFEAALALRYPHPGSPRFVRLGKPEGGLFQEAFSRTQTRNMVMIGDQLETDIRGALAFGIDAAWIETGVTAGGMGAIPPDLKPTYWLAAL